MSFQLPQNIPSFSSPQRPFEDNYWRANRNLGNNNGLPGYGLSQPTGISNKLNGFFGERALPMYKDKPYFAPRRTGPRRHRRKAIFSGICLSVLIAVWYYTGGSGTWGKFGLKRPEVARGVDLWNWVQSFGNSEPGKETGVKAKSIDWEARREKVRDAFIVSWDGYEKHAWGTSFPAMLLHVGIPSTDTPLG